LLGVYDRCWTEVVAKVLANLGTVHALVVHGEDGLDEITTTEATLVSEEYQGKIKNYQISPEDFDLKRASLADLAGGTALDNSRILLGVLNAEHGPKRDIVLLNSGAAIYVSDKAKSIQEGMELAKKSIDSKKALEKLELLKAFSLQSKAGNEKN
jgi:anthranilate phosphoribosyltransferase